MESRRSGLERAASGSRATVGRIEVSWANLVDREVAETEPASAWTGEKKPKIQSTPTTPGDLGNTARDDTERSSGEIVHGQEQEQEVAETEAASAWTGEKKPKIQSTPTTPEDLGNTARDDTERSSGEVVQQEQDETEGLNWDGETLSKKLQGLRRWMDTPHDEDYADKLFVEFDEEQQRTMNQRLALCRIRSREKQYRALDDASLLKLFPPSDLEDNLYYKGYEYRSDWFFDPTYCKFAHVEDYQRLVLRVTVEFEGLEIDPYARNTLADDQQFVQFWEKLSRKTKLIELYRAARSCERERIQKVLWYHALKIAEDFPAVYKTPIVSRFYEFVWGVRADYAYAGFLTKMWELLAKKQMNFTDALRSVYNEGKYQLIFLMGLGRESESEPDLSPMEERYKPHLDRIVEKAQNGDDVHQLVMDTIVENFWKPRCYYDYVRKKMRIAEEMGLIPKQPPHRLYTPGCYLR